ncbi:YibE/F family protein [Clostridium scatologenes]|uniref:YibE/F family protein n=1 Tax=Clostridium scatologenes TaxID=1548 RepID=A0A0E3M7P8_CLOSL|nr:YibE/F family protein [Clostridium scatologenes]AKA67325.1 YibE/F family protein [Clostridium scatologenes]
MEKILSLLKKNKFTSIVAISLILICGIIYCFISNNENYYDKTIAKIIYIKETPSKVTNMNGDIEQIKKQQIKSIIMNGNFKGQEIELENSSSYSEVNNLNLKVSDEVFISTQQDTNNKIISGKILNLKRDKYVVYITSIFIFLILLVGGFKGFRSLASVIINIIIFCIIIKLFIHGYNLIVISIIASLLFVILSISIVCGINKKTLSAVLGTISGTLLSMLIAVFVIQLNHWNGIKFEEMEFLTHPPEQIFYIEILIGTLGSIMDIAISISSSIKELCYKNPNIESKVLINSGKEIGKDIMGTMTNTLVFAYISGSIPLILLLLKNGFSIFYIISINLSLEFVRALTGSIGIILSIPITIYISVILFKNHKIGVF